MPTGSNTRVLQPKEICIAILAAFAVTGAGAQSPAAATAPATEAEAVASYDLPAQSLADSLKAIERISGQPVRFDVLNVQGIKAQPLKGTMSARQAVNAVTAGTGLLVSTSGGALVVDTQRVEVLAKRDQAETSYKADRSDTATRSGTDLMDVPGSMTIITADVLKAQQATNTLDALRNVSGINFAQEPQGAPQFSIRGFSATSETTNGVADRSAANENVYGIERIEVLKGPQAILAGGESLGGGVNIVTKKPTAEPVKNILLQAGTHMDLTVGADLSGPFSDADKRLTYRMVSSLAHADHNDTGYNGRHDYFFMPEVRWKDSTSDLTVGLSYERTHTPVPTTTYARNDGVILPAPKMLQSNKEDGFDVAEKKTWYEFEQKLTPKISFISRMQFKHMDQLLHLWAPFGLDYDSGAAANDPNGDGDFSPEHNQQHTKQLSGDHYFRFDFDLGPINNKLSTGFSHDSYTLKGTELFGDSITESVYPPSNYVFPTPLSVTDGQIMSYDSYNMRQKAVYAQDLLTYKDLSLLLNFRRTVSTVSADTNYVTFGFDSTVAPTTLHENTPGAGVVYRVNQDASLYASFSRGFQQNTDLGCGGGVLPPIRSLNKEVGAKFQLFGDMLSLTTAGFEIQQDNVALYSSSLGCEITQPGQVTRGIELDLQGQLAKGWNAIVNYTHQTARDRSHPDRVFPGAPKNKLNLWTVYDLPFESVKGLGAGLGLTATSQQEGTYMTPYFKIPAQVQLDTSLFYNQPTWHATLGVKNIANRTLYGVSTTNSYIPLLTRRSVMLTFSRDFQ